MITWKEFKEAVEAKGVKDESEIQWIDGLWYSKETVEVEERIEDGQHKIVIS
jgi:hypothetical protein